MISKADRSQPHPAAYEIFANLYKQHYHLESKKFESQLPFDNVIEDFKKRPFTSSKPLQSVNVALLKKFVEFIKNESTNDIEPKAVHFEPKASNLQNGLGINSPMGLFDSMDYLKSLPHNDGFGNFENRHERYYQDDQEEYDEDEDDEDNDSEIKYVAYRNQNNLFAFSNPNNPNKILRDISKRVI